MRELFDADSEMVPAASTDGDEAPQQREIVSRGNDTTAENVT